MSESIENTYCPCGSGYQFSHCCGVDGRTAVNAEVVATILQDEVIERKPLTTQLHNGIERFSTSPDLFPARISFAENKAWYVKMSPQWYKKSVFLDPSRVPGTCVFDSNLAWLEDMCQTMPQQSSALIFHTAFCGSTLMSQALEQLFNCLSLREPEILGNLLVYIRSNSVNEEQATAWLDYVMKLLSRRYTAAQGVVIKANDYANPMMVEFLKHDANWPMLFMYTPLDEFLAGCLKAKNRREWIEQRYQVVKNFAGELLGYPEVFSDSNKSTGELAAVYWSYNIALYLQAWQSNPELFRSLEFNTMLASPLESVQSCGSFFKLDHGDSDAIVSRESASAKLSGIFGVYSKNNKLDYSPEQRNQDIRKILDDNDAEVKAAETLARKLLGDDYPEYQLPGQLDIN